MLLEPVDEIWKHHEKRGAHPGQREWNKMEHRILEEGYGTCRGYWREKTSRDRYVSKLWSTHELEAKVIARCV
jgi:hypothetical protein